ncbi:MAG: hypothetical protein V7636_2741 [Actinomycetota bacterium]
MSAGVAGDWLVQFTSVYGNKDSVLRLRVDGDKLDGTMTGDGGSMAFTDGSVSGNHLEWTAALDTPIGATEGGQSSLVLVFIADVHGDAISGNCAMGAFGDAPFAGNRV